MLINNRETVGIKKLKSPKADVDFSQTVDNVDINLEDNNPTKKRIADMEFNKKIKSFSHLIVFKRKKTQYFACFFFTILFQKS